MLRQALTVCLVDQGKMLQPFPDGPAVRAVDLGAVRAEFYRTYPATFCSALQKVEVGAGWSKRSTEGRDYLSIKLDDPSFSTPIYANLVHDEGAETCSLIWSRPNRRQGDG
jgi:uncharacterized protein (DUF736 family)